MPVLFALALCATSCIENASTTGQNAVTAESTASIPAPQALPSSTSSTDGAGSDGGEPACALRSGFAEPSTSIRFFATCTGSADVPYPIYRSSDRYSLSDSLDLMTEGITDVERAAGIFSWFDTDGVTVDATIADGIVTLGFYRDGRTWRPDASTSSEVLGLVDAIAATVFSASDVEGIDRAGLCFGELSCDGRLWRSEFMQTQFLDHGVISTRSCDAAGYWERPASCSVSGISRAGAVLSAVVVNVADDDTLNMRAGPAPDAFIIANSLRSGSPVQATEVIHQADDGGLWRLVFDEADTAGWVNNAFLALELSEMEVTAASFVDFAKSPSAATLAELNVTAEVQLGLGPRLLTTVDRAELTDPDRWVIDLEYFRAHVGPFSLLEPLKTTEHWEVEIGPHMHCAGDPMPVPEGMELATIVSIQPAQATIESCLHWFAVDLFIDGDGQIIAVTFDTWEP